MILPLKTVLVPENLASLEYLFFNLHKDSVLYVFIFMYETSVVWDIFVSPFLGSLCCGQNHTGNLSFITDLAKFSMGCSPCKACLSRKDFGLWRGNILISSSKLIFRRNTAFLNTISSVLLSPGAINFLNWQISEVEWSN